MQTDNNSLKMRSHRIKWDDSFNIKTGSGSWKSQLIQNEKILGVGVKKSNRLIFPNIKVHVWVYWPLCATQNDQKAARDPEPCWNRTQVSWVTVFGLNHHLVASYWLLDKNCIWVVTSCSLEPIFFFPLRIVVLWLLKFKHYLPELLTANLLSIHVITLDIDWSCKIFT